MPSKVPQRSADHRQLQNVKRYLRLPAHFAQGAAPRNVPQLVVFFDRTEPTHQNRRTVHRTRRQSAATNSLEVKAQVKRAKMLGPLLDLASKLVPGGVSDQVWQRVIDPRNAATHEGQVPAKAVAESAIATTTELVSTAYPLSDFGLTVETASPKA
jgi:hypothetical protein